MAGQGTETGTAGNPGESEKRGASRRPIMALLDLLGRRWALRVLWELQGGPLAFRPLQAACGGLSPTVLNRRLAELRQVGVVDLKKGRGYFLTPAGGALGETLLSLNGWANQWAEKLKDV